MEKKNDGSHAHVFVVGAKQSNQTNVVSRGSGLPKPKTIVLEPYHKLILVQAFKEYPCFYDRTSVHWRHRHIGCKSKIKGSESIRALVLSKEKEALMKGYVKEAVFNAINSSYSHPFPELKRRFCNIAGTAAEQLDMVQKTGEENRFTLGYLETWKRLYDDWFHAAVASGNFGFGKLKGEEIDQPCCPDPEHISPKSHRAPLSLVRAALTTERSPTPESSPPTAVKNLGNRAPLSLVQATRKTDSSPPPAHAVKNLVTEETKFPLPVPKNSTPLPKSNETDMLDSSVAFLAASLRLLGKQKGVATVVRVFRIITDELNDNKI